MEIFSANFVCLFNYFRIFFHGPTSNLSTDLESLCLDNANKIVYCFSFSTMAATEHFDLSAYPNATAWFEKVKKEVPNYEKLCGEGAAMFGGFFKSIHKK